MPDPADLSDADLDRLESFCRAATPGPWEARVWEWTDPQGVRHEGVTVAATADDAVIAEVCGSGIPWAAELHARHVADLRMIAALDPTTILTLLAELARRRAADAGE